MILLSARGGSATATPTIVPLHPLLPSFAAPSISQTLHRNTYCRHKSGSVSTLFRCRASIPSAASWADALLEFRVVVQVQDCGYGQPFAAQFAQGHGRLDARRGQEGHHRGVAGQPAGRLDRPVGRNSGRRSVPPGRAFPGSASVAPARGGFRPPPAGADRCCSNMPAASRAALRERMS